MKFSELSYREYIAMEVFSRIVGSMPDDKAAWRAFGAADAFLKRAGIEQNKIKAAEERAERAESQVGLLLNMSDDFAARVALLSIWEKLDARNQTEAMQKLADMLS
jgi:hypothetical protein